MIQISLINKKHIKKIVIFLYKNIILIAIKLLFLVLEQIQNVSKMIRKFVLIYTFHDSCTCTATGLNEYLAFGIF